MGNEQSTGNSDVPDKPEMPRIKMERVIDEQPPQMSSDMGNEAVRLPGDGESTSQIVPQQEDSSSFSPPAEETQAQESSQEGSKILSLSQSSSSGKGHPIGETYELDIAKPPVESSSEKAENTTPQMPLKPAGELDAGTRALLLLGEGQSMDAELQKTAENIHGLAESTVQKTPSEIITWTPTEKEQDTEKQATVRRMLDGSSLELVVAVSPEQGVSEGHSQMKTALVTKPLESQSSAEGELERAEIASLPVRVGQNEGCPAVDAQATEVASRIPMEAGGASALTQQALDPFDAKPLESYEVEHAGAKFIHAIQNDGVYWATEAMSWVNGHPSPAAVQVMEAEPLEDRLAESSSKVLEDLAEARESSLLKEMDDACSDPAAIEMEAAQVTSLDEQPQAVLISCTEAKLQPVTQETEPLLTTDVAAQIQDLSGAQEDPPKGLKRARKQETKFLRTYFCCNAGEVTADREEHQGSEI